MQSFTARPFDGTQSMLAMILLEDHRKATIKGKLPRNTSIFERAGCLVQQKLCKQGLFKTRAAESRSRQSGLSRKRSALG